MKAIFLIFLLVPFLSLSQFDNNSPFGYLFAHMTTEDYGGLYYSISEDGMQWNKLSDGETITKDYHGHPDISQGHDDSFYMIGVEEKTYKVPLWKSSDLVSWEVTSYLPKEIFDGRQTPGHKGNPNWYGAPKLFYDDATQTYIITWHSPDKTVKREDAVNYWCSMRTFYVTTSDFKTFTEPKKLFDYDMGTIDVIVRKENELYYAILKDECEPSDQWPTGKSIRVAVSHHLTGPYSYPGDPISPNYHEAPTIIPRKNGEGWLMYYEMYTGQRYSGSQAASLSGSWYNLYQLKYDVPDNARHGCMIPLTKTQYMTLKNTFK